MNDPKIIVAVDKPRKKDAISLAKSLDPQLCKIKIGFESFMTGGPDLVEKLQLMGYEVFLDLKLFDILTTVAAAIRQAIQMDVWGLTLHASGGAPMMRTAYESLKEYPPITTKLIAVTVLTSMNAENNISIRNSILDLALLARDSSMDGVVCSAREANFIKEKVGNLITVCPGIRPVNSPINDQVRIMTPEKAIKNGADYLVIGRPITATINPYDALVEIHDKI